MIDEKRLETTPVQHIRNLMNSINDEKLTITYYDPIDPTYTKTYDVSVTAGDTDEFVSKYEALVSALEAIGKTHEKLGCGVKAESVLTSEQLEIWNTYICGFCEAFDEGEHKYPSEFLVNRAQRYEYFVSQNAPKCVIDEEGRCLAEEMILYYGVK